MFNTNRTKLAFFFKQPVVVTYKLYANNVSNTTKLLLFSAFSTEVYISIFMPTT